MAASFLAAAAARALDVAICQRPFPTDDCLAALELHAPICELGAGAGVWCHFLRQRGIAECLCFDEAPPSCCSTQVLAGGPEQAAQHSDHTLLLVQGAEHLDPARALEAFMDAGGTTVAHVGVPLDLCTSSAFAAMLLTSCELSVTVELPTDAHRLTFWQKRRDAAAASSAPSFGVLDVRLELRDLEEAPDWAKPPEPNQGERIWQPEIGGRSIRRLPSEGGE